MPVEPEPSAHVSPSADPSSRLQVTACPAWLRVVAVVLQTVATLNIFYITDHIISDIRNGTQTAPPLTIAVGLVLFSGVPWALTAILRHLFTATTAIESPLLVLTLRRTRFEIPLASITSIRPWRLPLPGPGLALLMKSGRRFQYRLQLADPGALLSALSAAVPSAQSALAHPAIAHARARHLLARRRWYFWLIKFGLFPLTLAILLFRLHQYIVYGGPFGEYHLLGLASYLKSFATTWAGALGGLIIVAAIARLLGEALVLPLAWALLSRVHLIRRAMELSCQIAYFGFVPAFVLSRILL